MIIEFKLINTALLKNETVLLTLKHLEIDDYIKQVSKVNNGDDKGVFGIDMSQMVTQVVSKMGYPSIDEGDKLNSDFVITMREYEEVGKPTIGDIIEMEFKKK